MFLKKIDCKIIEILTIGNISLENLSVKLGMTVRNMRYRIDRINEFLSKEKIGKIEKNIESGEKIRLI